MNKVRRLSALKRNITYTANEIARVEELRKSGEATVLAFPGKIDSYIEGLRLKIKQYNSEIAELTRDLDARGEN